MRSPENSFGDGAFFHNSQISEVRVREWQVSKS
jgi:hypothetical protein